MCRRREVSDDLHNSDAEKLQPTHRLLTSYADLKATKAQYRCDWSTAAFALVVDRVAKASEARGLWGSGRGGESS